jgi:hypothetical protein
MKSNSLLIALAVCLSFSLSAQYKTVVYDMEKNFFNEGQMLPFETYLMVNGHVPADVSLINMEIHPSGLIDSEFLYSATWKKSMPDETTFNLPLNYKLRQNSKYGIVVSYFYDITPKEKSALYRTLGSTVMSYIDQSVSIKGNDIHLSKNYKQLHSDLNSIVVQGLRFYDNDLQYPFPGFSEITKEKLKEFEKLNLNESKFYQFTSKEDSTYNKNKENYTYFQTRLGELKKLVDSELIAYINTVSYVMAEKKSITDYSTEKGQFILPVNLGYGAIYNSGNFDDFSYGSSPYVGLSFPLANASLKGNLLSNMNIAFGAYLNNFNDENDKEVTGPFIGRPLFLGVGARAFKFLRFNAGVTALQKDGLDPTFDVNQIYLRPSVNLNFELGVWIGQLK